MPSCKGCDITNKKSYTCDLCNDIFCINCMYLCCSICDEPFACFWCGRKHKTYSDPHDTNLRCIKHK